MHHMNAECVFYMYTNINATEMESIATAVEGEFSLFCRYCRCAFTYRRLCCVRRAVSASLPIVVCAVLTGLLVRLSKR